MVTGTHSQTFSKRLDKLAANYVNLQQFSRINEIEIKGLCTVMCYTVILCQIFCMGFMSDKRMKIKFLHEIYLSKEVFFFFVNYFFVIDANMILFLTGAKGAVRVFWLKPKAEPIVGLRFKNCLIHTI